MKLWHDDVRLPPDGWLWARTNDEARRHLETGFVTECSLDHDLGLEGVDPDLYAVNADEALTAAGVASPPRAETGLDLVRWMVLAGLVPPKVTIHSWNPDGARAMAAVLNHHGYSCVHQPFRP